MFISIIKLKYSKEESSKGYINALLVYMKHSITNGLKINARFKTG